MPPLEEVMMTWLRRWIGIAATVIGLALLGGAMRPALASPQATCRKLGTDDSLRPIPKSLVPAATRLFGLKAMPAAQVRRTTYFRCFDRHVLMCNVGANLPCGKANTSRHLAGADAWCAEHPDSDFIPMSATGHETIYNWRCRAGKAAITGTAMKLDPRGFIAELWKRVEPAHGNR